MMSHSFQANSSPYQTQLLQEPQHFNLSKSIAARVMSEPKSSPPSFGGRGENNREPKATSCACKEPKVPKHTGMLHEVSLLPGPSQLDSSPEQHWCFPVDGSQSILHNGKGCTPNTVYKVSLNLDCQEMSRQPQFQPRSAVSRLSTRDGGLIVLGI